MTTLYTELAEVYEGMYQTFINYKEEYDFYSTILKKNGKNQLLEIGSGAGDLANYFVQNDFSYSGLDLSLDMIALAKLKVPGAHFVQGDMRDFHTDKVVQSILMTGRTISYLLKNEDVNASFSAMYRNMEKGGILCFDFIDAAQFIPAIMKNSEVTHQAIVDGVSYSRESVWKPKLEHGMDISWDSKFYKNSNGERTEIGTDSAVFRSFFKDEIAVFLSLNGFVVQEFLERASYAFPTFVVVAEKV